MCASVAAVVVVNGGSGEEKRIEENMSLGERCYFRGGMGRAQKLKKLGIGWP